MTFIHEFTGAKGGVGTTVCSIMAAKRYSELGKTLLIDAAPGRDVAAACGAPGIDVAEIFPVGGFDIATDELAAHLVDEYDYVVIDSGRDFSGEGPDRLTVVTTACYLALRHILAANYSSFDMILVLEHGRSLDGADVEEIIGVPAIVVDHDPAIARAVDAGLLLARVPKTYTQAMRRAELGFIG